MSDLPNAFDFSKFKEKNSICTKHCLNYAKKQGIAGDQIRSTVNIQNEHVKSWYDVKEDGGLNSQSSYAEILNAVIVKIRQDCAWISELIQKSYGEVKNKEILGVDVIIIMMVY